MASHKWKARVIVKNFTGVDCQLNYNSTDGYQIPRVSIHNGMYGELCVVPIYSLP